MPNPPQDRSEFWIRFGCAFAFFGFLSAFGGLLIVDDVGIATACTIWAVYTIAAGIYAARHGDEAWNVILSWISAFW